MPRVDTEGGLERKEVPEGVPVKDKERVDVEDIHTLFVPERV